MKLAHPFLFVAPFAMVVTVAACAPEGPGPESTQKEASAECAASPWAEWTAYAVGDLVSYGGQTYTCIQAHTSEPGWTPDVVGALWSSAGCSGGDAPPPPPPPPAGGGGTSAGGGGNGSCDPNAWVYMGSDPNACSGHDGESCGWTSSNEGQGYHCQATSWGTGCEPGGAGCSGGGTSGGGTSGGGTSGGGTGGDGWVMSHSTWYCGDACGMDDTGSCGTTYCGTHVGSGEMVAAISQIRMNGPSGVWMGGGMCGKQIEIVALATGASVVVPVEDACEACNADDHVDLTLDVWKALGVDPCTGTFQQKWRFVN